MALESEIRAEALALGFAGVGLARLGPARTGARFRTWLERGYAAGMTYLVRGRAQREDPCGWLPDARSVIVLAAPYPGPGSACSGYALGRDYHTVLRGRCRALLRRLGRQLPDEHPRICVDTAPVLEREWAQRAGLGWIGRQGALVHPEYGCRLFLAEILTAAELLPDQPFSGADCGTCRRCLDACPSGALQADGLLDARRCLSYWTIEHRGAIPETIRPLIRRSFFGCDACTSVCPRNPRDRLAGWDEFKPSEQGELSPEYCLRAPAADLAARIAGTALARAGVEGLQRNAAVLLGNRGRAADRRLLQATWPKASPLVREHIRWALACRCDRADADRLG